MMASGRPSTYTPEAAQTVLDQLNEGKSLNAICREPGMPARATVEQWVMDDRESFARPYLFARLNGALRYYDKAQDDLDDASGDLVSDGLGRTVINSANISRLRERMQHARWVMSKFFPEQFGEKVQAMLTGPGGGPLQTQSVPFDLTKLSAPELRAMEAMLERAALPQT